MSQRLISHSPDLKRLQNEGYHIEIKSGWLLLLDVPHLDSTGVIKRGPGGEHFLAGDTTIPPTDHTAKFIGENTVRYRRTATKRTNYFQRSSSSR